MNGIESLRRLARSCEICSRTKKTVEIDVMCVSQRLSKIADKIEREHEGDLTQYHAPWSKVQDVMLDMERHCLGHEGMDDSPVARWARELREAMGDEECDHADEREAIAWVREHGGLDYVMHEWQSRVPRDRYERRRQRLLDHIAECETALGRRNRRIEELGHRVNDLTTENAELRRRAMPEGYEWPRFEDGEPVRVGDKFPERIYGHECTATAIGFNRTAAYILGDLNEDWVADHGTHKHVNRPAPKVLDADGVEICVGDTVYHVKDGSEMTVNGIEGEWLVVSVGGRVRHDVVTHRAPVIAADGRPLREGETVWYVPTPSEAIECVVDELPNRDKGEGQVTLRATSMKRTITCPVSYITHERPDSFEQLEKDANDLVYDIGFHLGDYSPSDFKEKGDSVQDRVRDIVRRARALAERGA